MGGGASSGGVEGLLATTMTVGRAIAGVYRNPGMYRIQDFHSEKAPRLKSAAKVQFVFFGQESDSDEEEEDDYEPPSPIEYEHMFNIEVSDETIYIDDVNFVNKEGWTALHTCCMSFVTVPAALKLIDKMCEDGGNIDVKTTSGPGSFNKGWTPLQMACAYGVEPVVEKLIAQGADVNAENCYGYTSLLEACHRGYLGVIEKLVKAGCRLSYIPDAQQSYSSPFQAAPPHCALGESARCGYVRIVTLLLDEGADKDQANYLGWTPLHEACFYNRVDVVSALLKAGCNTATRTKSGALPWHLSGLENIRTMLKEQGGPGTEPTEQDTINMIEILQEVTSGVSAADREDAEEAHIQAMHEQMSSQMTQLRVENGENGDEEDALFEMLKNSMSDFEQNMDDTDERMASMQAELFELETQRRDLEADIRQAKEEEDAKASSATEAKGGPAATPEPKKPISLGSDNPLLHSGPMLGNLPQLGARSSPPGATDTAGRGLDGALKLGEPERGILTNQELGPRKSPSKRAEGKEKKKKKKRGPEVPEDMPTKFICQLSQHPMQQPVKSPYGHHFEKAVIERWMEQQGRICPITGAPLAETDLKACDDLQQEIVMWTLKRSSAPALEIVQDDRDIGASSTGNIESGGRTEGGNNEEDGLEVAGAKDDLYDF